MLLSFGLICGITAFLSVVYCSFFEWGLHRYVMHRAFLGYRYPFEKHALLHHTTFKADHTYHLREEKDRRTIPMAWWNGPFLVLVSSLPFTLISLWLDTSVIFVTAVAVISLYYATYEYLHWCMHLPRERNIERTGVFFRLNGHHILHHRYMNRNFNVVLPLADFCLGSLLKRSKVHFNQVQGKMVPNLQPR